MSHLLARLLTTNPVAWDDVLAEVMKDFDSHTGSIHRWNPETQFLEIVAHAGIPPQLLDKVSQIPLGKGIAGVAAQTREPVELCNLQEDLGGIAKDNARQTQARGTIAVAIEDEQGQLLGSLGVGMLVPHDFTCEEKARMRAHASAIATKLK